MIDLSLVIVSYNVKEYLKGCLKSIYESTNSLNFEIIVVDNSSKDDTASMIKAEFPEVILIVNEENLGYAKGVNLGLKKSRGRYIGVMNPDTVVGGVSFDMVVDFMDKNPQIGNLGGKVLTPEGEIIPYYAGYPSLRTTFLKYSGLTYKFPKVKLFSIDKIVDDSYEKMHEVRLIGGCFTLIRRGIIDDAGLMDEQFFLYYEDFDWCYRIKKNGWKIYYFPNLRITHYGGKSSQDKGVTLYEYESMYKYFEKHYGDIYKSLCKFVVLCCLLFRWLYLSIYYVISNKIQKQIARQKVIDAILWHINYKGIKK